MALIWYLRPRRREPRGSTIPRLVVVLNQSSINVVVVVVVVVVITLDVVRVW